MKVTILPKAEKQIRKLPELVQIAVIKKVRDLANDKENLQIKKLSGYTDMFRLRVGRYRIVYQSRGMVAEVVAVQHRKDIYQRLS